MRDVDSDDNAMNAYDIIMAIEHDSIAKARALLPEVDRASLLKHADDLLSSASKYPEAMQLVLDLEGIKEKIPAIINEDCSSQISYELRYKSYDRFFASSAYFGILKLLHYEVIEKLTLDDNLAWVTGKILALTPRYAWGLVNNRFVQKALRESRIMCSGFISKILSYEEEAGLMPLRRLYCSVLFAYRMVLIRDKDSGKTGLDLMPLGMPKEIWELIMYWVWEISYFQNPRGHMVTDHMHVYKHHTGIEGKFAAYNGPLTEENVAKCLFGQSQ